MATRMNKLLQAQVAQRLALARMTLDLDKFEMAAELGISKQRWGNYENGVRPLDIDVAVKLCKRTDIPLEWLFMNVHDRVSKDLARKLRRAQRLKKSNDEEYQRATKTRGKTLNGVVHR
jgi:transcriptional regulator with XRE-family HTH domain